MAKVEDAQDAEDMVRSRWHVGIPEWDNFRTRKQGYAWIVIYDERRLDGREHHEVHINAQTGSMTRIS